MKKLAIERPAPVPRASAASLPDRVAVVEQRPDEVRRSDNLRAAFLQPLQRFNTRAVRRVELCQIEMKRLVRSVLREAGQGPVHL